ncbi:hypothetical protein [Flavobacterium daemonense]|uniref:hypothetical protein n=1 Tax=Flavobacterium daemonense TaxID=1393049 RepID=UPI0011871D3E|nr:hypothetical protein [Flavobacterium daemonense]KAF2329054.1 hypothetical protein FND99_17140 [Flavobacterium daemonense]
MEFENYYYMYEKASDDMNYYQEDLLLDHDRYLDVDFEARLAATNHYNLELGELEEDLEDDFLTEYDENDWEEEDSKTIQGEYDSNEGISFF